jgi:hypothetical protein
MAVIGSQLVLVVPIAVAQNPADTTGAHTEATGRFMRHGHGWRGIVGGVIWLAVVVYVLWLATRVVRAVEKLADKSQGRA